MPFLRGPVVSTDAHALVHSCTSAAVSVLTSALNSHRVPAFKDGMLRMLRNFPRSHLRK
jgi:hypothetical protein